MSANCLFEVNTDLKRDRLEQLVRSKKFPTARVEDKYEIVNADTAKKRYLVDLEYWMHPVGGRSAIQDLQEVANLLLDLSKDREVYYHFCAEIVDKKHFRHIKINEIEQFPPAMSTWGFEGTLVLKKDIGSGPGRS
jgi:hypothetical protein